MLKFNDAFTHSLSSNVKCGYVDASIDVSVDVESTRALKHTNVALRKQFFYFKQIFLRTFRSFILVIIRPYNYSFTFNYSALFEQKKCLRTDTLTFLVCVVRIYIGSESATLLYRFDTFFFFLEKYISRRLQSLALLCYIVIRVRYTRWKMFCFSPSDAASGKSKRKDGK